MKYFAFALLCLPVTAQTKLEPDAQGCSDSKVLPKLELCRIDNCEKKESDHREVPIREDEHGEAVTSSLDGDSRSVMYECVDGTLRYCLFAIEETDVKSILRGGSDDDVRAAVRASVHAKWIGHEINSTQFVPPPRPMYSIGG